MTIKFSVSAGGFFDTDLHRDIPADAVTVTAKRHADLFAGQAEGKEIIADDRGRPQLRSLSPTTLGDARAACVQAIRREAAHRIDQRMPLWKQINALRDGSDPGFHEIDAIRSASNLIEANLAQITDTSALQAFDAKADPLWPEFDA